MEAISIIFVLTILSGLIVRAIRTINKGKKLAKNDPVLFKKGDLVYFNDRLFEISHRNKDKYNLKGVGNIQESLLSVPRKNLKKAS